MVLKSKASLIFLLFLSQNMLMRFSKWGAVASLLTFQLTRRYCLFWKGICHCLFFARVQTSLCIISHSFSVSLCWLLVLLKKIGQFCRLYSIVSPPKFKLKWLPFPCAWFQDKGCNKYLIYLTSFSKSILMSILMLIYSNCPLFGSHCHKTTAWNINTSLAFSRALE